MKISSNIPAMIAFAAVLSAPAFVAAQSTPPAARVTTPPPVATTTGIERHWWSTAYATHVVYTLPFAFLVMLAIFNRFDASVEEASWSLGVPPATTFRKVTFPLIFPGVLSAMLFAFTLSYDEFSRTLFSSGREQTLPLAIYSTFAVEIHPNVFAFGVLTTLFSFALLAVYAILMTLSVRRARRIAIQEAIG